MAVVTGVQGKILVSAADDTVADAVYTELPITRWQVSINTDMAETTAGIDPIKSYVPGYTDIEIVFDCLWDTNLPIISNSLSTLYLFPGNYCIIALYLDKHAFEDTSAFVFPRVLISSIVMDDEVRGIVKYTVIGKQSSSLGIFSDPISYPEL